MMHSDMSCKPQGAYRRECNARPNPVFIALNIYFFKSSIIYLYLHLGLMCSE